jgi:hypothetical protein
VGPLESHGGRHVCFVKSGEGESRAIWQVPVEGGEESLIVQARGLNDFAVSRHGLYYRTASYTGLAGKPLFRATKCALAEGFP